MNSYISADSYKAMWRVFIVSDGKRSDFFYFHNPVKAIRMAFIVKKQRGIAIAKSAVEFLSKECKSFKEAAQKADEEQPKEAMVEETTTEQAAPQEPEVVQTESQPRRRPGRPKKNTAE